MFIDIWQVIEILVTILIILIFIGYAALPIYLDRTDQRCKRIEYIFWNFGVLMFFAFSKVIIDNLPADLALIVLGVQIVVGLILFWKLAKRVSWRTRDARLSRWIAYFAVIMPFINIFAILLLMIWPTRESKAAMQDLPDRATLVG